MSTTFRSMLAQNLSWNLWKRVVFITAVLIVSSIYLLAFAQTNLLSSYLNPNQSQTKVDRHQIHLVVFSDLPSQKHYQQFTNTLFCYAHRHGYSFTVVDPHDYYACRLIANFFFRKQCAVISYIIEHPELQWLVVLDGDTFVVNATKSLDSFIPDDPTVHLVHYERFMDNEVMAGNYIIRNHPWSLFYLNKWTEYFKILPNVGYSNNDNGALHLHVLNMSGLSDGPTYQRCATLYNRSENEALYMDYVSCTKCALKGRRKFPHMIIHRRGQSFCRDPGLYPYKTHPLDIMFHGYKFGLEHFLEEYANRSTCITDGQWTPKLRSSLIVPDMAGAKILMEEWEKAVSKKYNSTVSYPEIAHCWPDCEAELTGAVLANLTRALCKSSAIEHTNSQ